MNALLKSALVGGLGIVGPAVFQIVSAPTGGLAAFLVANPALGAIYALGVYALHNLISAQTAKLIAVPAAQVTPTQAAVTTVVAELVAPVVAKL
jgi:hypothetical protein